MKKTLIALVCIFSISAQAGIATSEQLLETAKTEVQKVLDLRGLTLVEDSVSVRPSFHFGNAVLAGFDVWETGSSNLHVAVFSARDESGINVLKGFVYLFTVSADMEATNEIFDNTELSQELINPVSGELFNIRLANNEATELALAETLVAAKNVWSWISLLWEENAATYESVEVVLPSSYEEIKAHLKLVH